MSQFSNSQENWGDFTNTNAVSHEQARKQHKEKMHAMPSILKKRMQSQDLRAVWLYFWVFPSRLTILTRTDKLAQQLHWWLRHKAHDLKIKTFPAKKKEYICLQVLDLKTIKLHYLVFLLFWEWNDICLFFHVTEHPGSYPKAGPKKNPQSKKMLILYYIYFYNTIHNGVLDYINDVDIN